MKVVHICTSLDGGAGLCASRIIQATRQQGAQTKTLVMTGEKSDDVDVVGQTYPWSSNWLIKKYQAWKCLKGEWPASKNIATKIEAEKSRCKDAVCFTSPMASYTHLPQHPWIAEADIIHLHWIGGFVDYESFFSRVKKPIVWTIHDENPGLGGFHYSFWKENAPATFKALDDKLARVKKNAYKHVPLLHLVAISTMMADYFRNNDLLKGFPSTIIYNGINGDDFYPISRNIAREVLGIEKGHTVFLFVAQNIHEGRKGLHQLMEALELLNLSDITLICIGSYKYRPQASFNVRCEGFVPNSRLLSLYHSAADYLVMPSFQEAFAQTPLEAMACGVPVIAFPCSGAHDLINERNGIVCEDFTVDALAKGIKEAMHTQYDSQSIRKKMLARFSYDIIAQQYLSLYRRILIP